MNQMYHQAHYGKGDQHTYIEAIDEALQAGFAAKEVACSMTTGWRLVPSVRTAPGLNPYHASVADTGYGFDAVLGTIERLRQGEHIPAKELLVLDLDTLGITQPQIHI
jgi:hypothetical protein